MVIRVSLSMLTVVGGALAVAGTSIAGITRGSCGPNGGISISGSYTGAKWSISGHIGGSTSNLMPPCGPRGWDGSGIHGNGYRWFVPYGSYGQPYAVSYRGFMQPIDTTVPRINPQLLPGSGSPTVDPNKPAPKPSAPPPTTVEKARMSVRNKGFADAIKLFKEHLKTTADDAISSRQLAVTLIESKDLDSGAALLRELYRKDPTLAEKPYVGGDCGQDSSRLRDMVGKLSAQANKSGSPSAWLAVVVLMQADGRTAQAAKILDKAKAGGLESEISSRFAAIFHPPKPKPGATPAPASAPASTPTPSPAPTANPTPGPAPEQIPTPAKDEPAPEGDKGVAK